MKILILLFLTLIGTREAAAQSMMEPINVLILGGSPTYAAALKKAREVSVNSGVAFEDLGKVYDPKTGRFQIPKEADEPEFPYTGRDIRECDPECLSVESSDIYPGMQKGLFLVVGGVFEGNSDGQAKAKEQLKRFKKVIPDAYLKKSSYDRSCPL